MAKSYANLYPNSIDIDANRTQNASNTRIALSGVAGLNALIISYNKNSKDTQSSANSYNTETWLAILKQETELV